MRTQRQRRSFRNRRARKTGGANNANVVGNPVGARRFLIVQTGLEALVIAGGNLLAAPEWCVGCLTGDKRTFFKTMSRMGVYDFAYGQEEVTAALASQDWCIVATTQPALQAQFQIQVSSPIQLIESGDKRISGKMIRTKTLLLQTIEKQYQRETAEEESVYNEIEEAYQEADQEAYQEADQEAYQEADQEAYQEADQEAYQEADQEAENNETIGTASEEMNQIGGAVEDSLAAIRQILLNEPIAELHTSENFTISNILDALHKKQTILHIPATSQQSYLNYLIAKLPNTRQIEFFFVDKRRDPSFALQYNYDFDVEQPMIIRPNNHVVFKLFSCLQTVGDLTAVFRTGYQFLANIRMGEIQPMRSAVQAGGVNEDDDLDEAEDPLDILYAPKPIQSTQQSAPVVQTASTVQLGGRRKTRKYRKGIMATSW